MYAAALHGDSSSPTSALPATAHRPPPTPMRMPSLSMHTTTSRSITSPSPSPSPYLDPHTTVAEGYQSRWKSFVSKLSSLKRRGSSSGNNPPLSQTSTSHSTSSATQPMRATLTERNLTQYSNPEYTEEHEAYQARVNPYDNRGKRERVGEWIRGLP